MTKRKHRRWTRLGLGVVLGAILLAAPPAARCEDVQGIAAVVNDDVISKYDLEQRINLFIRAGNGRPSPEIMAQLSQEALKSLIDERLQLQEAKRQKITVTDKDVDGGLERLAQHNGMSVDQMKDFFAASGIDIETLRSKVRAQIAWNRLITHRFMARVSISSEEVNSALKQMKANANRPERHVAEIVLHVDTPEQEDQVRRTAEDLASQLRSGAPFPAVAHQYSQSATAAVGGDIGWVAAGQLSPPIEKALDQMSPGQVSEPIRTSNSYTIVALLEQRSGEGDANDSDDTRYTLRQLVIPVAADDPGARDAALARANALKQQLKQCSDMGNAPEASNPLSGELGTVDAKDLPPDFQQALAGLNTDQVANPLVSSDGVHVLMVCDKQTAKPKEPTRDLVEQQLTEQQLDMMARRYLRDLRRDALIEYRVAEH